MNKFIRTLFPLLIVALLVQYFFGQSAVHVSKSTMAGLGLFCIGMANTIDSKLQLTEVLDAAMMALKRKLFVLKMMGAIYQRVQLKGDDTMAVPFYPLTATGTSQVRAANGSYKALVTGTTTESRKITNFTNQVQALSFTSRERARQPIFDPVKHGQRKGEALAYDIIADIFSIVKASNFTGTTIAGSAAANFDEGDVGDMRTLVATAFWPDSNRNLILNPSYGTNLLKQPQIIAAQQRGDGGESFRDGVIGRVLGFDVGETAGLPTNNGVAFNITATATTDLINAVAHPLVAGDRIIFPTATGGGAGLTAATKAYFVINPLANSFQVALTPGGAAVDITTDYTGGTAQRFEDVQGIACLDSAVLIGFAPVPPTEGVQKFLVEYEELVDEDSGLVLQYRRIAYPDTDEEVQAIECHYGYGLGDIAQLKIIRSATAS